MGASKSQLFTDKQNQLAGIAKVLGHPARLAILDVLATRASCICNDIVDEVPLAQPTISQHLKELKNIGLIKGEIEGTSICYCLDLERLEAIKQDLNTFFDQLVTSNGCC